MRTLYCIILHEPCSACPLSDNALCTIVVRLV